MGEKTNTNKMTKYFVIRTGDPLEKYVQMVMTTRQLINTETNEVVGLVCEYKYDDLGEDVIMYKDHPLFNSTEDAKKAFDLGNVIYVELHFTDGTVEFGFAQSYQVHGAGGILTFTWLDGYLLTVPYTQLRKVLSKTCEI